jgi:hypothetical protein
MAPSSSRPIAKKLAIVAGAMLFATAGIGALHMPCARSLLMRVGGCPMAGARVTPKEMDSGRRMALEVERGTTTAPARPAVGFTLDGTSVADVHAWAAREHVSCEDRHPGLVVCTEVRPDAVGLPDAEGTIDELALGFNQRGVLANETTTRARLTPQGAEQAAHVIVASLSAKLGPADKSVGSFAAQQLAGPAAASISTVSYRYVDYVAEVSAINLPRSGLSVREHYMSAND